MFIEIEKEDGRQGNEENSTAGNQNTENTKEVIYKVEKKTHTHTHKNNEENTRKSRRLKHK